MTEPLPSRSKRSTAGPKLQRGAPRSARRNGDFLAAAFKLLCKQNGLPMPTTEHQFHPTRKWRMDFAWIPEKLYLECDGAIWTHGRHTRGAGWFRDTDKINHAAALGWRLMRASPQTLCTTDTIELVRAALTLTNEAA